MEMRNWLEYLEEKFKGIVFDRTEAKITNQYYYRFCRKQGTYMEFELVHDNSRIRKMECGKYWPTKENVYGYETSCVKGVFDTTKKHLIDFIPVSSASEFGDKYELEFSVSNVAVADQFLKIPLETGWKETYYIYKENYYRFKFEIDFPEKCVYSEMVLLQFFKQEFSMLQPEMEKKLRGWWADLAINKRQRRIENEFLLPVNKPSSSE